MPTARTEPRPRRLPAAPPAAVTPPTAYTTTTNTIKIASSAHTVDVDGRRAAASCARGSKEASASNTAESVRTAPATALASRRASCCCHAIPIPSTAIPST